MKKTKTSDYFSSKRRIEVLRRHLANNSPPQVFSPILRLIFIDLPLTATELQNKVIYRSRWNEDGKLFSHTDDLRYPPKEVVKKKGRLNDVGERTFYASLCELGSIIESQPHIDQLFTIAKIEKVDCAPLIFFPLAVEKPPFTFSPKNKKEKMIFDYLYGEITKRVKYEDEYNSTIAMAHHFFGTKIEVPGVQQHAGIAYASAVGRETSNRVTYNLAMTPDVFDINYRIEEATVHFLSNEQTQYRLNVLNVANIETNGQLMWELSYEEMQKKLHSDLKQR